MTVTLDPQWEPPAPPREPGTNGAALGSLILGAVGLCAPFAVIGIVLGVVALVQIRRSGQKGTALAVLGLCAGLAWLIAITAVLITDHHLF
ncbi:hypothetical protein Cs7R123_77900 [Catellatospora sp. TT07R-123]|uniref:DUF4190 domain-containing protein n=1 Tax=Catellatospora sp. TT07R-123 TaxID=2733863 RepID=UPI001B0396A1|nr:DUF4190 domain-containing protein [Catellatospora sp. TT07R-123]GHJ50448.1 hypothetical protein Cs7R123_77900 [Catellatospora sp. TT07R-123]